MQNSMSSESEIPSVPVLCNLQMPILKTDPMTEKLINQRKGQYKTKEQQMMQKHKKSEDKNPDLAIEAESEGDMRTINVSLLYQCQNCENWLQKSEKWNHQSSHASRIEDYLYLGGSVCASNIKQMRDRLGITNIINCANQCPNAFYDYEQFKYTNLQLYDNFGENITKYFDKCMQIIENGRKNNQKTLVHCAVGKSRSATIVISYIMKFQNKTLKEAYYYVKQRRSVISPNPNYVKQLLKYELQLYGKNSIQGSEIIPIYKYIVPE